MAYEEEIDGGWMTLKRLSILIESNNTTAHRLGLTLSWAFVDGQIRARIKRKNLVIFEKFYKGKHTHIHIAEFHDDFSTRLEQEDKNRWREIRFQKKREEEQKELEKPSWLERIEAARKAEEEEKHRLDGEHFPD